MEWHSECWFRCSRCFFCYRWGFSWWYILVSGSSFDAVEAVLDLFEWLFEKVGEIFTSSEKDKNLIILPTTPEVEKIIGTEIEKGNVTVAKEKVKLRANKSKLQAIVADGKVKKIVIAGSEQGFSQEIKEATERGRLYKIPVED